MSTESSPTVSKVFLKISLENIVKDIPSLTEKSWIYGDIMANITHQSWIYQVFLKDSESITSKPSSRSYNKVGFGSTVSKSTSKKGIPLLEVDFDTVDPTLEYDLDECLDVMPSRSLIQLPIC